MNQLLGGRYQFIKVLKSDAMEQTYLVEDTQDNGHPTRLVKRLQLVGKNPRTLKFVTILLKKKAESLRRVGQHDQVPQLLDFFEENNNFYLVEEFISGTPLNAELLPNQPWKEPQVVDLLKTVLEILLTVHGWGVIHRCITPMNLIRRDTDRKLVLTDFGIFKEISSQVMRSQETVTKTNITETSVYTPPEQIQGQLQFSSDLYALGIIGIQALTGLSANDLAKMRPSMTNGSMPVKLSWRSRFKGNADLADLLDKMTHPLIDQRYQMASEVLEDLHRIAEISQPTVTETPTLIQTDTPKTSPKPRKPRSPSSPSPRPGLIRWGIAGVTLAVLLGVLVYWRLPQRIYAQWLMGQATIAMNTENDERALQLYSQIIALNPTAEAYAGRGQIYNQQGELEAALDDLTRSLQMNEAQPDVHYHRGNVRFALGDRQGAIDDYTAAIQLQPDYVNAYVNRGSVRADQGDEQGAITDYTEAIQRNPNLAAAYLNRCLSRSNINDHQGAIADCSQAISLQPNSVLAYQNRGLVRRRIGDFTGAIEDFNIAIRLAPDDPDPYYNRGLARYELGDQMGAIADYTEAIQRNPDHVFAYYDRALVHKELGQIEEAIADLQQSAKLCLDSGRRGCYDDAQYQLSQLQSDN
jgi:serine/threonine-protein kinase